MHKMQNLTGLNYIEKFGLLSQAKEVLSHTVWSILLFHKDNTEDMGMVPWSCRPPTNNFGAY